jgi:type I restriction enzyme, S subunit
MSVDLCHSHLWRVRPLGEVADIILGGTPSTEVEGFWGGNIPWMSSGEVNKRHIFEVDGRITEAGLASSNATLVDPQAVAIGLAGQGKTRGTVALVHIRVCTNQSIALIRGKNGMLDTTYLFHNLDSRYEELRSRSAGSGRAGLSREILQHVPIALPDACEQKRIGAVLDTVDEAITKTEALIAKLKQVRAGLLHDLLTRGLDKNGQVRDPIAHPEQFKDSPFGRIPREWKTGALGLWIESSAFGPRFSGEHYDLHGNVATLRTTDMDSEGNLDLNGMPFARLDIEAYRSHLLKPGDVLVSRSGTCGITAVFQGFYRPVLPGAFLIRFRPTAELLPEFMRIYLNWPMNRGRVLLRSEGGVQKNLRSDSILDLTAALPAREEQGEILSILNVQSQHLKQETDYLAKLALLKSGLMTDLLTGRVRVAEPIATSAP